MPICLEPFEKAIVEVNDRFRNSGDKAINWEIAQEIVRDIGGNAINIAGTTPDGMQTAWGLSSMSQAWLDEYHTRQYYLIDPFVAAWLAGDPTVMTNCGVLEKSNPAFALNHALLAHGYGSLYASTVGSPFSGYRTIVVFCSAHTLDHVDAQIGFDKLRVIHAIIAANIPEQPGDKVSGLLDVGDSTLTTKERDILTWLACGLRNDQIAFKARIAEVTVRKHLTSIRLKLGATTREQAIAIAVRDGWIRL